MFLFQIVDNEEVFSTHSKNPVTKLSFGDSSIQVVKLFGDNFKLVKEGAESFHKTFAKTKIMGTEIDVYSIDIDLFPDDSLSSSNVFKRSFHSIDPYPALVIFYDQEVSIVSCFSLSVINIGSDLSNHLCFDQLQPRHITLYLKKESVTVATSQNVSVRVDAETASGAVEAEYGSVITLSDSLRLVVVSSKEILDEVLKLQTSSIPSTFTFASDAYPCVISNSPLVRPLQLALKSGGVYTIGREPSNDIWVAAPHISRVHCVIRVDQDGETILVEDQSTNGTLVNNQFLTKGQRAVIIRELCNIDLGKNIKLVICFSPEDRDLFLRQTPRESQAQASSGESVYHKLSSKDSSAFKRRKLLVGIILLIVFIVGLIWSFLL